MGIKQEWRVEVPEWLKAIDPARLRPEQFDLNNILTRSLFYPASRVDGTPVKCLGGVIHSFVYADYGIDAGGLLEEMAAHPFRGYCAVGYTELDANDIAPNGWRRRIPRRFHTDREKMRTMELSASRPAFVHWYIFLRNPWLNDDHGPGRFSLLYVGGDGVAAYQALYVQGRIAPLALAIIQPGTNSGGNYTNFTDPNGFLAETVLRMNGEEAPELLVCDNPKPESYWPREYSDRPERCCNKIANGVNTEIRIWKRGPISTVAP